MILDLDALRDYAANVTTPTREEGVIKISRLLGTQEHLYREIARGLEDGIHSFYILKGGRQVGGSTGCDILGLQWLQTHLGMVGQVISDDQPNMRYRRKVLRQILRALPKPYRFPTNADNADFLELYDPTDETQMSTLLFDYAGVREGSNLGRSKGLNFLYADEVGSWQDEKAVDALKAALAERYPYRLFLWISTARGYNVWHDLWHGAEHSVTTRRIFLAWWMHDGYSVPDQSDPRWDRYGGRLTSDEKMILREVKRTYAVEITPAQWVWYRWKRDDEFGGDEKMMRQEFGSIPEECFQSFGNNFIEPEVVTEMKLEAKRGGLGETHRYTFGPTFDTMAIHQARADKATLHYWTPPDPYGAYIVAGHASGSSSPEATTWVAQVWQAWPDHLKLVAEYASETGTTQEFTWILIHLAGYYRDPYLPYIVNEAQGPGRAVEKHLQLFREQGFGLSHGARAAGIHDVMGAYRHYFWSRPDHLGGKSPTLDLQTNATERPFFLHMVNDVLMRRQATIPSRPLVESLARLRQGEHGDNDQIAGGGGQSDAHAMCMVLAVRCWQDQAMYDLERTIPKKHAVPSAPTHMGEVLTNAFLQGIVRTGRPGRWG